ncbi:MAG: ABC transporter permease subunit [Acidobacteria bacterium]|nr:ABC transporter permease subunit [Acidobacteriota bacterium]
MTNILAIANKELRSYFASPIAYVLIGLFAALFGVFFYLYLAFFVRESMQMGMGGPQSANVNMQMIRPIFGNASVIVLFVLPMVTMRSYSEEKRSGTIELLLTSPVSDWQIILGKFFGAIALYLLMLLVTILYMGILFVYGNPEWRPVVVGYLGLLLLGASFISFGLLISSFTKNQIVAAMITFAFLLILWVISWTGEMGGPTTQKVMSYLSITEHFDDFSKGIIDTKHVMYYLSFVTLGLFLTSKSVDSERWRG